MSTSYVNRFDSKPPHLATSEKKTRGAQDTVKTGNKTSKKRKTNKVVVPYPVAEDDSEEDIDENDSLGTGKGINSNI